MEMTVWSSDRLTVVVCCSDGAHEAMLAGGPEKVPKLTYSQTKKKDDYDALQSFLRSISSTATLPPYIKGETYSSAKGVFNQVRAK